MDERLREARDPYGRRLFYPPGSHPACSRLRDERKRLLELPETPERDAALEHVNGQLARFEAIETEAKVRFLRASS